MIQPLENPIVFRSNQLGHKNMTLEPTSEHSCGNTTIYPIALI